MRRTIRAAALILCALTLLLTLCACGENRTPATKEQFAELFTEKGYTVEETTEDIGESFVVYSYDAKKDDQIVEFYIVDSIKLAENNVAYYAEAMKEQYPGEGEYKKGGNYRYYSDLSDGSYRVVSSIDRTFIFAEIEGSLAPEVEALMRALGYID